MATQSCREAEHWVRSPHEDDTSSAGSEAEPTVQNSGIVVQGDEDQSDPPHWQELRVQQQQPDPAAQPSLGAKKTTRTPAAERVASGSSSPARRHEPAPAAARPSALGLADAVRHRIEYALSRGLSAGVSWSEIAGPCLPPCAPPPSPHPRRTPLPALALTSFFLCPLFQVPTSAP